MAGEQRPDALGVVVGQRATGLRGAQQEVAAEHERGDAERQAEDRGEVVEPGDPELHGPADPDQRERRLRQDLPRRRPALEQRRPHQQQQRDDGEAAEEHLDDDPHRGQRPDGIGQGCELTAGEQQPDEQHEDDDGRDERVPADDVRDDQQDARHDGELPRPALAAPQARGQHHQPDAEGRDDDGADQRHLGRQPEPGRRLQAAAQQGREQRQDRQEPGDARRPRDDPRGAPPPPAGEAPLGGCRGGAIHLHPRRQWDLRSCEHVSVPWHG